MKRVLILLSDTGGGHRASAQALRAAFLERLPETVQVDLVDAWMHHTPFPLNQLPKSYNFLAIRHPWMWRALWGVGLHHRAWERVARLLIPWTAPAMGRMFRSYRPDLVISVHPLLQHVPLGVLRRMGWPIPFVTVVTDLASIHPTWFCREVQRCFVASSTAREQALAVGMDETRLRLYGLPIRPAFARRPPPRQELRAGLRLAPDLPAVLIMGGGEGMGRVAEIADAVAGQLAAGSGKRAEAQMVIVCGRNRALQDALQQRAWPLPVIVNGFVDNVDQWMHACDCIVTKAGPGTIAEALVCGLPIVLSGFIPGQETGNVDYVVQNGVGAYQEDPRQIGRLVAAWLLEPGERKDMAENARRLANPQAVYQIVDEIAALLA